MGSEREAAGVKKAKPTPPHPFIDQSQCVPAAQWQSTFPTNCNTFHEVDFALGVGKGRQRRSIERNGTASDELTVDGERIVGLGGGKWRAAWRLSQSSAEVGGREDEATKKPIGVVIKTLQFSKRIQFDELSYRRNQIDAAINDRLSPSPYIIDAFGFCGQSALGELAAGTLDTFLDFLVEKTRQKVMKKGGKKTKRVSEVEFTREWAESLPKRLRLARDAARALAHLQTVDGGGNVTIAHTDFRPANLVVLPSGRVKLNDFNSGEMVMYNATSRGPCMFRRGRPKSAFKCPPERVENGPLLPASDVYSLGSVVFGLLVGRMPYSDVNDEEKVWDMIREGIPPRVSKFALANDHPAARAMLDVSKRCMTLDPLDRPSAKRVAEELGSALQTTDTKLRAKSK